MIVNTVFRKFTILTYEHRRKGM